MACVRTYSGRVRVKVEGHPGRAELVIGAWVQLSIRLDCELELLFAHIAPGTHCVANSDNLELCHCSRGKPEGIYNRSLDIREYLGLNSSF